MIRGYDPVPGSCALVRRDVVVFLATSGLDEDVVESAVLVANELASNAIDHARTPFRLLVAVWHDHVRIEVADGSRTRPLLQPHDPDAVRGRGLQIVDHLTSTWGCEVGAAGKTVAADLRLAAIGV